MTPNQVRLLKIPVFLLCLLPAGQLVLEHSRKVEAPTLMGLELTRSRRYGDTVLSFYRPTAGSGR